MSEETKRRAEAMRVRSAEAKRMANEVWPWLGVDFKQARIVAQKVNVALNKNVAGVIGYEAVERWLNENREHVTAEFLCEVAGLGWKAGRSHVKRHAASSKNENVRSWVLRQWCDRADQGQSKASFARQYVQLVKKKFGLDVTTGTIERDWLPKG